jgi:hypothetical protein
MSAFWVEACVKTFLRLTDQGKFSVRIARCAPQSPKSWLLGAPWRPPDEALALSSVESGRWHQTENCPSDRLRAVMSRCETASAMTRPPLPSLRRTYVQRSRQPFAEAEAFERS